MKRKKTTLDLMQEVRRTWTMNPITRVHDNDIRKNRKKDRRQARDAAKKALREQPQSFFDAFFSFPAATRLSW